MLLSFRLQSLPSVEEIQDNESAVRNGSTVGLDYCMWRKSPIDPASSSTALKNQTIEDLFHMAKDTNLYGEEMNEESLMFLLGKVVYNSSAMG